METNLTRIKKAVLKAEIDSNSFRFSISDEGDGFDPDAIKNPLAEENLLQVGGRGVFFNENICR